MSGNMAWFISDNHFNHTNIIEYCNRPFNSTEEMDEYMISQWNNTISSNDIVYHLGDFALGLDKEGYTELVSRLNGNIILIRGNHDRKGKQWLLDCGFIDVRKRIDIGKYILTHRPQALDKMLEGYINLHGHIHNHDKGLDKEKYFNVSVEVLNYKPTWIDLTGNNYVL